MRILPFNRGRRLSLSAAFLCLGLAAGGVYAAPAARAEASTTGSGAVSEPVTDAPAASPAADDLHTDGGAIDGIYACEADVGGVKQQTFVTLNGKRDGKTIYLVSAVAPDRQSLSGFGIGLVSGHTFAGATSDGKKFGFEIGFANLDADGNYEGVTLTGKAGLKTLDGKWVNVHLTCKSIW